MIGIRIEPWTLKALVRCAWKEDDESRLAVIASVDGAFYSTNGMVLMRVGTRQKPLFHAGEVTTVRRVDVEAAIRVANKATDRIVVDVDQRIAVLRKRSKDRDDDDLEERVQILPTETKPDRSGGEAGEKEGPFPDCEKAISTIWPQNADEPRALLSTAFLKAACQAIEDLGGDTVETTVAQDEHVPVMLVSEDCSTVISIARARRE